MKSFKVVMTAAGLFVMLFATSCRKEAIQQEAGLLVKTEKAITHTAARSADNTVFPDIDAFLNYFDAVHRDGFEATIVLRDGGVTITGTTETGNPPTPMAAKHDMETKDKIKFAKWCNEQLNKGKTLTIGKNPDGTYWGDIN